MSHAIKLLLGGLLLAVASGAFAADGPVRNGEVHYRVAKVDGLEIFYREAGSENARTLLRLHGFPTSSHMFRDLIPLLADRHHVIAPDSPGFGNSSTPDVAGFNYTSGHLADVMQDFFDEAYKNDLPKAEPHVIKGAAHFELETHARGIAAYMRAFLDAQSWR